MLPNDTISAFVEMPNSGGTACDTILAAVNYDRSILYGTIRVKGNDLAQIKAGGFTFLTNLANSAPAETLSPYVLPANVALTCERANNKAASFRVAYVDRNLALTSATTTTITGINLGFTSGEIISSIFLFLIFIIIFFDKSAEWLKLK